MKSLIPWRKKNSIRVRNGSGQLSHGHDEDLHPVVRLRHEFDQLMDRFWDDWGGTSPMNGLIGRGWNLDLQDRENEYILSADLPGFAPDEIDVTVSGNVMTVRAEHKEEEKSKNGSSCRYGSVYDSFTLPCGVESDKIDAKYHNGVLNVHLPKSEDCKAKRIAVKSA